MSLLPLHQIELCPLLPPLWLLESLSLLGAIIRPFPNTLPAKGHCCEKPHCLTELDSMVSLLLDWHWLRVCGCVRAWSEDHMLFRLLWMKHSVEAMKTGSRGSPLEGQYIFHELHNWVFHPKAQWAVMTFPFIASESRCLHKPEKSGS